MLVVVMIFGFVEYLLKNVTKCVNRTNLSHFYLIMIYQKKKQWTWKRCDLILRRAQKQGRTGYSYESLSPQIEFIDHQVKTLNFQIDVQMDVFNKFDPQIGFYWHKSWFLPTVSVKTKRKYIQVLKKKHPQRQITVQVISAYPIKQTNSYYLQEVGLQGEKQKNLDQKNSDIHFSNLRFEETSFSHSRNRFSLVVIVHLKGETQQQTNILASFISPPVYVDSRRAARNKIAMNSFLLKRITFEQFKKPLTSLNKRKLKLQNRFDFIENSQIEDSFQGFIDYYSAANIRNKIKHPFYIGYHFPKTFSIYYNSQYCFSPLQVAKKIQKQVGVNSRKMILFYIKSETIQKKISQQNQKNQKRANKKANKLMEKLRLQIFYNRKKDGQEVKQHFQNGQMARRKLTSTFQYWKYFFAQALSEEQTEVQNIPKKWVKIQYQNLLQTYFNFIDQLQSIKKEQQESQLQIQQNKGQFQYSQIIQIRNPCDKGSSKVSTRVQGGSGNIMQQQIGDKQQVKDDDLKVEQQNQSSYKIHRHKKSTHNVHNGMLSLDQTFLKNHINEVQMHKEWNDQYSLVNEKLYEQDQILDQRNQVQSQQLDGQEKIINQIAFKQSQKQLLQQIKHKHIKKSLESIAFEKQSSIGSKQDHF